MPFFGFTNPLASKPAPSSSSQDLGPSVPVTIDIESSHSQPSLAHILEPTPTPAPPLQERPKPAQFAYPYPTITSTPASPIPFSNSSSSPTSLSHRPDPFSSNNQSHAIRNADTDGRPALQPRTMSHASRSSAASASSLMSGTSTSTSGSIDEEELGVDEDRGGVYSALRTTGKGKNGAERRGRKRSDDIVEHAGTQTLPEAQTQGSSTVKLTPRATSRSRVRGGSDIRDLGKGREGGPWGEAVTGNDQLEEEHREEEKRRRRAERKARAKRASERVEYDTYVIVRPPASSTKRPLNLQIQLVIPARGRSGGSTGGVGKVAGEEEGRRRVREVRSPSGASVASALSTGTTATTTTTTSSHLGGLSGFGSPMFGTGNTTPDLDGELERRAADAMDRLKPAESNVNVNVAGAAAGVASESGMRSPGLELYANVAGAAGGLFSSAWAGLGLGLPLGSATPSTPTATNIPDVVNTTPSTSVTTATAMIPVPRTATIEPLPTPLSPCIQATRQRPDSNNSTDTQKERTEASATVRLRKAASDSDVKGRKPLSVLDGLATPTKSILLPRGGNLASPPAHATYTHERPPSESGTLSPDQTIGAVSSADLSRSGSIKSELSSVGNPGRSANGGALALNAGGTRPRSFSGASLASSQGASCGKKIVPLWNLSVHNVIHTTVTDAGTDARVARFTKRAIEVIDVGALEPMEIHTSRNLSLGSALNSNPLSAQSTRTNGTSLSAYGSIGSDGPMTPESNGQNPGRGVAALRASFDVKRLGAKFSPGPPVATGPALERMRTDETDRTLAGIGVSSGPTRSEETEQFGGSRKIFGKLFKRKDGSSSKQSPDGALGSPISTRSLSTFQGEVPSPISIRSSLHAGSLPSEHIQLGLPTFGCQPGLVGSSLDGRTRSYAFTIRKWVPGKAGSSSKPLELAPRLADVLADQQLDVIVEWVKGTSAARLKQPSFERALSPSAAPAMVPDGTQRGKSQVSMLRDRRVSLTDSNVSPRTSIEAPRMESPLKSLAMRRRPASTASGGGSGSVEGDDGEDSDPEDSETPWYCIVRCPGTAGRAQAGGRAVTVIATLFPAPHHPRVVGQIKVPTELPSIATGLVKPLSDTSMSAQLEEVWLSDENLKDIIGSTAMWLVVREEFGGLGKRKKV